MRVLLDECLPRRLAAEITAHDVTTVSEQGWSSLKNGELLRRAEQSGMEVFVTMDAGLRYQQNLSERSFGVLVLKALSNRLDDLLPLAPSVVEKIAAVRAGDVVTIE